MKFVPFQFAMVTLLESDVEHPRVKRARLARFTAEDGAFTLRTWQRERPTDRRSSSQSTHPIVKLLSLDSTMTARKLSSARRQVLLTSIRWLRWTEQQFGASQMTLWVGDLTSSLQRSKESSPQQHSVCLKFHILTDGSWRGQLAFSLERDRILALRVTILPYFALFMSKSSRQVSLSFLFYYILSIHLEGKHSITTLQSTQFNQSNHALFYFPLSTQCI